VAVVDDVRKMHENLLGSIEGLSDGELKRPGTIGDWSIRDALLHMAMWDGEVLKQLAIWRNGGRVDWSYVNDEKVILKFNDFWVATLKHLSTKKILQILDATHAAIIASLAGADTAPGWVTDITVNHNNGHIEKIKTFRKTLDR